jgi:prepilin-type processing-associated H-X9-DG protein
MQGPLPLGGFPATGELRNGMAVAALVLGILGLVLCPIGPLLGLVALALGIVALVRAGNLPEPFSRRGMAITGICLGGASVLVGGLFLTILIPALARARELSKRAVCAANQRAIGQGYSFYANDGSEGFFLTVPHLKVQKGGPVAMAVRFVGQMGANMTNPTTWKDDTVHPSRSLFLLVANGMCTAKQFVCPSSGDSEDDLRNTVAGSVMAAQPGANRFDFKGYPYLSYGCQLPFGRYGQPDERLDARMAFLADKGPYFQAGTPRSDGSVPDQPVGTPGAALMIAGATTEAQLLQLTNDQWRPYNSRNHSMEGQNVLFQDGHVEFVKRPIVGVNYDNIYTVQGPGYTLRGTLLGRTPADKMGPFTDTDSVIVP